MSLGSHPLRHASVLVTAVFVLSPIAPRFKSAGSKSLYLTTAMPQQHRANETGVSTPIFFEPNLGQAPPDVLFVSRNLGQGLEVRMSGFELAVARRDQVPTLTGPMAVVPGRRAPHIHRGATRATIRAIFVGANSSTRIEAIDQTPSRSNYFIGNDPSRWLTNVPHFERIVYRGVWPGIDVHLYGKGGKSEYDIVLAAGAALADIRIAFKGGSGLTVDRDGNLIVSTPAGELVQPRPTVYQPGPAGRIPVAGEYKVLGNEEIGFEVAAYDPALPLVIDPVIGYSTYLGPSGNNSASAIATLPGGEVLMTGDADSSFTGGPTAPVSGSFFVAKFGADDSLIYFTMLGPDEGEAFATGIGVDAAGNVIVSGSTYSANFPVTAGSVQTQFSGSVDAFVVKLSPDGSTILYSTLLGGNGVAVASGLAVDESGQAYVTGFTISPDFPVTPGAFQTVAAQKTYNGFVSKLSPAGDRLVYSTFLTGIARDDLPPVTFANAIAVDSSGSAYVTGYTDAIDLATPGAFQTTPENTDEYQAFVARLAPDGASLLYGTYLSAEDGGEGNAIAVDGQGNAYVTGTATRGFPTTRGVYQTKYRGTRGFGDGGDAFVAELNAAGDALVFSTYLGGTGGDSGNSIVVDPSGFVVVAGTTTSTDFPLAHAIQQSHGGGTLFKSSDGGNQWSPARSGLTSPSVTALVIHPKSHTTLFAGTANDGVYKSIDGGASWSPTALTDNEVSSLVWDGPNASALYAVCGFGLFRTSDGAANWESLLYRNPPNFVAVDPTDPATLYIDQPAADSGYSIYKSTDAGSTWAETGLRNKDHLSLVIDPARPSHLFAGSSDGVFKSVDGGVTWAQTQVKDGLIAPLIADGGEPPTLIALTIFGDIMTSYDGGQTWGDTGSVWPTPGIFRIAVDPSNPNLVYATTTTRLLMSRHFVFDFAPADRGLNNVFVNTVAVDPQNSAVVYAGTGNGVYDSFLARFDATGKNLLFSTYIGGSGDESVGGIALRPDGSVLVAGETNSQNFATTAGALQTVFSPYPGDQSRELSESSGYLLEFPAPSVKGVTAGGADLVVSGANFDSEATVLVNGVPQKTRSKKKEPGAVLIAVGTAAGLAPGQTVQIQVANSDMTVSRKFAFTP